MLTSWQLVRSEFKSKGAAELLTEATSALLGVSDKAAEALAGLGLQTVFDLATSRMFATAYDLARANEGLSDRIGRYGRIPGDVFDKDGEGKSIELLLKERLDILREIGPADGDKLEKLLDIATVRDLGVWPPYHAARYILSEAYGNIDGEVDNQAPQDLLPVSGQYPTEHVQYEVLVFDKFLKTEKKIVNPHFKSKLGVTTANDEVPESIINAGQLDIESFLSNSAGFTTPAVGGILTYSQSWYFRGLTLGNLIHGVALAPGESTKIAMIDWSRRTSSSVTEAIDQGESLQANISRTRSISEITHAVARETQSGASAATTFAHSEEVGRSTGHASLLPLIHDTTTEGTSYGSATSEGRSTSWSTSSGERDVSGEMSQNIADTTHQAAQSTRNRRASIVKEVSQSESEKLTTRTVTNYNHMHALTVQYYEVVQIYRTILNLSKAERALFIPMKLINFLDPSILSRFRLVIGSAGLIPKIRALSLAEPDHIVFWSPIRVGGWSERDILDFTQILNYPIGQIDSPYLSIPSGFAENFSFGFREEAPIEQAIITFFSGGSVVFNIVDIAETSNRWTARFHADTGNTFNPSKGGYKFGQISRIELVKKKGNESYSGKISITLTWKNEDASIRLDSPGVAMGFSVQVPKDVGQFTILELEETGGDKEVIRHLIQNQLYYSQAIWKSLDPAIIGMLLSRYTYPNENGKKIPLLELIDPVPAATVGNYLCFRAPGIESSQKVMKRYARPAHEDIVPVPSGGVFAEAVLGRFNSAEKLDITRFWNWQDSPIPIQAPDIAPLTAGTRKSDEPLTPGQLGQPVLNIVNAPPMPDPQGLASALAAVQNGNMFRDMSGLAATIDMLKDSVSGTQEGAAAAATQAGQNAAVAAQLRAKIIEAAANVLSSIFGKGGGGSNSGAIGGLSGQGAKINQGKDMDQRAASNGSVTGASGQSSTQQSTSPRSGNSNEMIANPNSNEEKAFRNSIGEPTTGPYSVGGLPNPNSPSTTTTTASKAWPMLDRSTVMARLIDLKSNPALFNQGGIGLCTAAAFLYHVIQKNPNEFFNFATALYGTGVGFLGRFKVNPDSDLRNADYSSLARSFHMPPQADWMLMSAIRDSENWFFDFEGSPSETVAMSTSAEELSEWYKKTGFYTSVKYSTDRTLTEIKKIKKTANNQIALWFHIHLLGDNRDATHILSVESPIIIDEAANKVTFDYWTWAQPIKTLNTTLDAFKTYYYGSIIAEY